MTISVVCPGCKKRFSVSDKYAGQKGPCPSCKTVIQIPEKAEEVVIHAPEGAGPKDSKGKSVVKPILREETRFDPKIAGAIAATVLAVFVIAWVIGSTYKKSTPPATTKEAAPPVDKKAVPKTANAPTPQRPAKPPPQPDRLPLFFKALAALVLGPPLAFGAYSFLRNDEFEPYRNKELWIRVAACGAVYALLWGLFGYLPVWLGMKPPNWEVFQLMYVAPPFVAAGAFAAYVCFELEMMMCVLHYGLYLITTVLLRVTAGLNAF